MPRNLKNIGYCSFCYNELQGTLVIPEAVTRIGGGAFTENKISKVIIPASVTFMGYGAFDNSTLKTAIIKNTEGSIEFEEVGGPFSDTTTVIYDPNYTE